MDIDQQLDALSYDGDDQAMASVFHLIGSNPRYIPKGLEILSTSGTDPAVAMIFITANTNPDYVPNGIQALAESGNKTAPLNIYNLVNSHPETAHILRAFDVLAKNGGNVDVDAIRAIINEHPDFIPEGFQHLSDVGTQHALQSIVTLMSHHKDSESLGLKTLKEHGGELGDLFHKSALDNIIRQGASGNSQLEKPPRTSPPAQNHADNYGLEPEQRLEHLAKDGSDEAVNEMYRIMTNYKQHIPKGLNLLGQVGSNLSVLTIKHIVMVNKSHILEGIAALGQNQHKMALVELERLATEFPEPEHISKALKVLGERDSREAIITIGDIMKDNPDQIGEGFDALKKQLERNEAALVIETIGKVMNDHMEAVPEGLVILNENGSPEAMQIFDRFLEALTGTDLTSPAKPDPPKSDTNNALEL